MRKILFLIFMAGWCLFPAMQTKAADEWAGTYTYKDKDYGHIINLNAFKIGLDISPILWRSVPNGASKTP